MQAATWATVFALGADLGTLELLEAVAGEEATNEAVRSVPADCPRGTSLECGMVFRHGQVNPGIRGGTGLSQIGTSHPANGLETNARL